MNLTKSLLNALRCPETKQPLRLANPEEIEKINAARKSAGDETIEGALIREDRQVAYPIVDGFPILLVDEAVALG